MSSFHVASKNPYTTKIQKGMLLWWGGRKPPKNAFFENIQYSFKLIYNQF